MSKTKARTQATWTKTAPRTWATDPESWPPVAEDWVPEVEGAHLALRYPEVLRQLPRERGGWDYVTNVSCPRCRTGTVRREESGYVPGYRTCDGCGRHFKVGGFSPPTLVED